MCPFSILAFLQPTTVDKEPYKVDQKLTKNKRNADLSTFLNLSNTGGRGRTGTSLRTLDFESSASANSATPANSNWGSWIRTNA